MSCWYFSKDRLRPALSPRGYIYSTSSCTALCRAAAVGQLMRDLECEIVVVRGPRDLGSSPFGTPAKAHNSSRQKARPFQFSAMYATDGSVASRNVKEKICHVTNDPQSQGVSKAGDTGRRYWSLAIHVPAVKRYVQINRVIDRCRCCFFRKSRYRKEEEEERLERRDEVEVDFCWSANLRLSPRSTQRALHAGLIFQSLRLFSPSSPQTCDTPMPWTRSTKQSGMS